MCWLIVVGLLGGAGRALFSDAVPDTSVGQLIEAGAYDQAVSEARRRLGPDPATLTDLAWALVLNGEAASGEAQRVAREAVDGLSSALGREHPLTAGARVALGAALLLEGQAEAAQDALVKALPTLRTATARPGGDGVLAQALVVLAEVQIELEAFPAALASLDEAQQALGNASAGDVARARMLDARALATLYLGDAEAGHALAARAIQVRATRGGHADDVRSLTLLGDADYLAGRMEQAGRDYRGGVEQAARRLAPRHPFAIYAASRLATWEADAGDFEAAVTRQRQALEAARVIFGPRHPRVGDGLNDLARIYSLIGDPEAALPLYNAALEIAAARHGRTSNAAATPLYNLARVHAGLGQWEAAEGYLREARAIWLAVHGPEHVHVARVLADWADLLARGNRLQEAVSFYEQALKLRLPLSGERHPATADVRAGLAQALGLLGHAREADTQAAAAQATLRSASGRRERIYADVLALRARLAADNRRAADARGFAVESDRVMRAHVVNNMRFLGEPQALSYVHQAFGGRDVLLDLVTRGDSTRALREEAFEAVVGDRSLVLDEIASRAARARLASNGPLRVVWRRVFEARQRLTTLLYRADADDDSQQGTRVQDAWVEVRAAEQEAALGTAAGRTSAGQDQPWTPRLARELPHGTVLVSFVRHARVRPTLPDAAQGHSYVAFVLRRRTSIPAAVALGDAEEIDALVRRWHTAMGTLARGLGGMQQQREAWGLGTALAARIWQPLRKHVGRASRVVVVPDGSLALVNFAALPAGPGRYLVESGPTFHWLSAERDLLRAPRPRVSRGDLLVVGAPAFGPLPLRAVGGRSVLAEDPGPPTCVDPAQLEFKPLPASRLEAQEIAELWKHHTGARAKVLLGEDANEGSLARLAPGYAALHIASHGFAFDSLCSADAAGVAAPSREHPRASPLLLSGLAFSGANVRRWSARRRDDGVMTGEEIAGLDLNGADWVVLSGCDTGRGIIRDGEGVLGLRRAFAIAGARTVVMSLWPVDDEASRTWMHGLYEARLARGRDTADAVREASSAALARQRQISSRAGPSRWAAFVSVGDWR